MTLEEYIARTKKDEEWAPGWEAIDQRFEELYSGQNPEHFATNMVARAIFGGEEYLDGYSVYTSPNGYKHIVTFGLTELYANEDAFGKEYSKWGYEMTVKLPVKTSKECMWALDMMGNLARYTFKSKKWFEPFQYVAGNGQSINRDIDSAITALLIVEDSEVPGIGTVHGQVDFLKLVGITEQELQAVKIDRENVHVLLERMKQDNPMLLTDLTRTTSYL